MKKVLAILGTLVALSTPVLAIDSDMNSAAGTVGRYSTTNQNAKINKPDAMVEVDWSCPAMFKWPCVKYMGIRIVFLETNSWNFNNIPASTIAEKVRAKMISKWLTYGPSRNVNVLTDKDPSLDPGDWELVINVSNTVGDSWTRSRNAGGNEYSDYRDRSSTKNDRSDSSRTRESYMSLQPVISEIGSRKGRNIGIVAPDARISAAENGTIGISESTADASSYGYRSRRYGWVQNSTFSVSDWSWGSDGRTLDAKSVDKLVDYLSQMTLWLACQELKARQVQDTVTISAVN